MQSVWSKRWGTCNMRSQPNYAVCSHAASGLWFSSEHGTKINFYANPKKTTQVLFPQILLYNYTVHTAYETQAVVGATYIPSKDRSYFRRLKSLSWYLRSCPCWVKYTIVGISYDLSEIKWLEHCQKRFQNSQKKFIVVKGSIEVTPMTTQIWCSLPAEFLLYEFYKVHLGSSNVTISFTTVSMLPGMLPCKS